MGGLAVSSAGPVLAWAFAVLAFAVTLAALLVYWQRSLAEIQAAIKPMHPTPPDELDAPF